MKKGTEKRLLSAVLTVVMMVTMLAIPSLSVSATVVAENTSLAREVAGEGIVLLKNDNNALPFADGTAEGATAETVALFGQGQIYDGTNTAGFQIAGNGSAAVSPVAANVIDPLDAFRALETAGRISLYDDLSAAYENNMTYVPDDTMYTNVGENADTAVVIITRNPSSSGDRTEADWNLTEAEKAMLKELTELKKSNALSKIVVLLNTGSTIDTSWAKDGNADEIDVDAVLAVWYPGEQGGNAIADILMGDVNPSGKLSDTFVNALSDYPAGLTDNYIEDIFVGYRYFETFGIEVSYPFGYGLSYTTFSFGTPSYSVANGEITVTVDVTNTGNVAGKEVVQVYYSAPQKGEGEAKLSKSSIELAAFKKTGLIQPGEKETVTITYKVNDMASYDDEGDTGYESAYVLEAGGYDVYVGNSVKEAQERKAGTYTVSSLTVTEQLTQYLTPQTSFNKIVVNNTDGTITQGTQAVATGTDATVADRSYTPYTGETSEEIIPFTEVLKGNATYEQFVAQMTADELIQLATGQAMDTLSGSKGAIGAGATTDEKYGIPAADTANGPCGIQITSNGTAFGSEVLMACTWNTDLIYELGQGMGAEAVSSGADILLTTSMNIHRHPLSGRHFEYFSEDPVLMGEMGSSEMRGIQSKGVTVTLKHFAVYSRRYPNEHNSVLTERAAREIYLKGFEIAVKDSLEGKVLALMSSYNKINGTHASATKSLVTGILRNEWGFEGIVVSDWGAMADASNSLLAGNNVKMPGSQSNTTDRNNLITDYTEAYNNGEITRNQLELNAIDVLKFLAKLPDAYIDVIPTSRIYASSYYYDNSTKPKTISNLYDKDKETDWAGYKEGTSITNRLVVDLGKETDIKLIEFVSARLSSFRNPFKIYVSNDNEFMEKTEVYEYTGGNSHVTYKIAPASASGVLEGSKYRYVVFEGTTGNERIGMSELSIYADPAEASAEDNSLINLSGLTPAARILSSGTWGGSPDNGRITDMSHGSAWMTTTGGAAKAQYVFIDLQEAKKLDSIALTMSTASGIGTGATVEDLRTDFDIVARNDNNFDVKENDTVLVDYTGTLAKGNGDRSGLCVFEVPEAYKETEFRYVGIRKEPSTANNNIGQICINELSIYGKAEDYPQKIDKPTAAYDKSKGIVTISTIARTTEDRPYKLIVAAYDEEGMLVEVAMADLKKVSEATRAENGSEVQGLDYASSITKTIQLDITKGAETAKVFLINDFDTLMPITSRVDLDVEDVVQVLPDKVLAYMQADFEAATSKLSLTRPQITEQKDVVIDWDDVDGASSYTFTLSANSDYSDAIIYSDLAESNVTLNQLFVGTKYFWKAVSDNGSETTGTFKTQKYAPRFITTETVDNVRDMGGWTTESGKKIKQGLIYRGGGLSWDTDTAGHNGFKTSDGTANGTKYTEISESDISVFVDTLGIKSDIDLRGSDQGDRTTSPLGESVTWHDLTIGGNYTTGFGSDINNLKAVFKLMADESNYPIYFHCTGGCDRTGRVAYLLNGLLGVSKEDLIRDWELSSFSWNMRYRGDSSYWSAFSQFITLVDSYEGNTLSEKIENIMINTFGLTQAEVDSIKTIMLGE